MASGHREEVRTTYSAASCIGRPVEARLRFGLWSAPGSVGTVSVCHPRARASHQAVSFSAIATRSTVNWFHFQPMTSSKAEGLIGNRQRRF